VYVAPEPVYVAPEPVVSNPKRTRTSAKTKKSGKIENVTPKKTSIAYLLFFFFGIFGVHQFYLGNIKGGILRIALLVGFSNIFDISMGSIIPFGWFSFISLSNCLLVLAAILWVKDLFTLTKQVEKANITPHSASVSASKVKEIFSRFLFKLTHSDVLKAVIIILIIVVIISVYFLPEGTISDVIDDVGAYFEDALSELQDRLP
jgi:TM2 domain-containing membrane protein YozV